MDGAYCEGSERFEQTEKVRGLAQGRYSGNFVALGFELI